MRHFRRHANGFPKRGMRVNGFADVDGVGAHLDRQGHFANHVASIGTDHAAAQDFSVAVGHGLIVEQQLGDAFVAAIGNRAAG